MHTNQKSRPEITQTLEDALRQQCGADWQSRGDVLGIAIYCYAEMKIALRNLSVPGDVAQAVLTDIDNTQRALRQLDNALNDQKLETAQAGTSGSDQ